MPKNELMQYAGYEMCRAQSPLNDMCANIIYLAGGYGSDQLDNSQISTILQYSPASSSIFQIAHYGQEHKSGRFEGFDFGLSGNQERYKKYTPLKYDLTKVTSKVALHYGENDWLAAVSDVDKLASKLQNMEGKYRVNHPKFNHMDFVWGKDAKTLVYDKVIRVMANNPMAEYDRYTNMIRLAMTPYEDSDEEEDRDQVTITPGWGFTGN